MFSEDLEDIAEAIQDPNELADIEASFIDDFISETIDSYLIPENYDTVRSYLADAKRFFNSKMIDNIKDELSTHYYESKD